MIFKSLANKSNHTPLFLQNTRTYIHTHTHTHTHIFTHTHTHTRTYNLTHAIALAHTDPLSIIPAESHLARAGRTVWLQSTLCEQSGLSLITCGPRSGSDSRGELLLWLRGTCRPETAAPGEHLPPPLGPRSPGCGGAVINTLCGRLRSSQAML